MSYTPEWLRNRIETTKKQIAKLEKDPSPECQREVVKLKNDLDLLGNLLWKAEYVQGKKGNNA